MRALHFNPRTPRGVRRSSPSTMVSVSAFQSTHPARGATALPFRAYALIIFQSTHPARGATGDTLESTNIRAISIHAPREGCDGPGRSSNPRLQEFQSTHPARGATRGANSKSLQGIFQSTHPARGATRPVPPRTFPFAISIHAPREGCDYQDGGTCRHTRVISIHAPREGCDMLPDDTVRHEVNFNPRTPRGVRQQTLLKSREFAWLNLLICTRGRRLSIQKQTRLCSIKLSFMLFGCEPAGEGVSSWTSHAIKSKVRLEGRSAYSQSVRFSAHSDFPGNKSGGCPVRDP